MNDKDMLKELLAIIHRDGGQYTDKVGFEQSLKDAITTIVKYMNTLRELRLLND